jgi:hypothetical protein
MSTKELRIQAPNRFVSLLARQSVQPAAKIDNVLRIQFPDFCAVGKPETELDARGFVHVGEGGEEVGVMSGMGREGVGGVVVDVVRCAEGEGGGRKVRW